MAKNRHSRTAVVDENVNMSAWSDLAVPEDIEKCLREEKMYEPTPIQKVSIPAALNDQTNVFGAAPTGSGKTLAFLIPICTKIQSEKIASNYTQSLRSIILTPTRELAVQIKNHAEKICKFNRIKIGLVVGGLSIQKQERVLSKLLPDIVIATPGRLWEIINNDNIEYLSRQSLSKVKYLVIDEADRMIEQQHFQELRYLIECLNENSSTHERQCYIFSATLSMIKDLGPHRKQRRKKQIDQDDSESLLIQLLKIDRKNLKVFDLTKGGTQSKPCREQLTEAIIHCFKSEKDLYLYYFLIKNPGRTIVFCNSIDCLRRLLNIFRFLRLDPLALHSAMPQKRRLLNVERFTARKNALLFATDVAARGLDLPKIDNVVHYQVPSNAKTYIHRTGRTARSKQKGFSLILCDPKEEAYFLRNFSNVILNETIVEYPIESKLLKQLKERVRLALYCDSFEHKLRKDRVEKNWIRSMADACDLIVEEDSMNDFDDQEQTSVELSMNKNHQRCLKFHQKRLDNLLRQPLHKTFNIIH